VKELRKSVSSWRENMSKIMACLDFFRLTVYVTSGSYTYTDLIL